MCTGTTWHTDQSRRHGSRGSRQWATGWSQTPSTQCQAWHPPVCDARALLVLHKQVHLADAVVKHLNLAVCHAACGRRQQSRDFETPQVGGHEDHLGTLHQGGAARWQAVWHPCSNQPHQLQHKRCLPPVNSFKRQNRLYSVWPPGRKPRRAPVHRHAPQQAPSPQVDVLQAAEQVVQQALAVAAAQRHH